MPPLWFEFRVCQNPECGLRYPVQRGSRIGMRCPICLGRTVVVAKRAAQSERQRNGRNGPGAAGLCCLLDNVRSALNVGSIFRSAEGYGFGHLYLCGITSTPEGPRVAKTGLNAERTVAWSWHRNAVDLVRSLKADGFRVWALEHTEASRPIDLAAATAGSVRRLLVVGNEQAGVDPGVLSLADQVVHLEMMGSKKSFNVGVAFAIAAHVLRHEEA